MSLEFDVCHSLWKPVYYSQDLMTGMGATGRRASRGWEFRTAMTSGASWYMQNDLQALQNRLRPLATSPSLCHSISALCIYFVYQDFPARETFLPTLCADGKVVSLSETKCLQGGGHFAGLMVVLHPLPRQPQQFWVCKTFRLISSPFHISHFTFHISRSIC